MKTLQLFHLKSQKKAVLYYQLALFGLLCFPLFSWGQTAVWDANTPCNLNNLWNINVPANQIEWYITDKKSSVKNKIENPSAYIFNANGRDEWGRVQIEPQYICPESQKPKTFSPPKMPLEVLDYGIYFMDDFAVNVHKYLPIEQDSDGNPYFDPAKPTVIFVHGWQFGNVKDHKRGLVLGASEQALAQKWRRLGWNFGIFYWNQMADDNLLFAENKIYDPSTYNLTWRKEDDNLAALTQSNNASPDKSVTDLFLDAYYKLIDVQEGKQIRLVGHSLGTQLVLNAARLMPPSQRPARIELLDPWFSRDHKTDFTDNVTFLNGQGLLMSWYESTFFNDLQQALTVLPDILGSGKNIALAEWEDALEDLKSTINSVSEYEELKKQTAYISLNITWGDYVSVGPLKIPNPADQHNIVVNHYFSSIDEALPQSVVPPNFIDAIAGKYDIVGSNNIPYQYVGFSAINAAACDLTIKNYQGKRMWQAGGGGTLTTSDDLYAFENNTKPVDFLATLDNDCTQLEAKLFDAADEPDNLADDFISSELDLITLLIRDKKNLGNTSIEISSPDLMFGTAIKNDRRLITDASSTMTTSINGEWKTIYCSTTKADYPFDTNGNYVATVFFKDVASGKELAKKQVIIIDPEKYKIVYSEYNEGTENYNSTLDKAEVIPDGWGKDKSNLSVGGFTLSKPPKGFVFTGWVDSFVARKERALTLSSSREKQAMLVKIKIQNDQYMQTGKYYGSKAQGNQQFIEHRYEGIPEYIIIGPIKDVHYQLLNPNDKE